MENPRTVSQKEATGALCPLLEKVEPSISPGSLEDRYEQPSTQQQQQRGQEDKGVKDAVTSNLTSSTDSSQNGGTEPKPPTRKRNGKKANSTSTSQCKQDDVKPPYSYIVLVAMSISQSPNKMLTLGEICEYIIQQFPYYRKRWPSWKNCIQQNLSLNDCFIKVPREYGSSGKGNFWKLHPASSEMFKNGSFLRRRYRFLHQLPQKPYADHMNSPTALRSPGGITSFLPHVLIPKHELPYGVMAIPCIHTAGFTAASCILIFPDHQPVHHRASHPT